MIWLQVFGTLWVNVGGGNLVSLREGNGECIMTCHGGVTYPVYEGAASYLRKLVAKCGGQIVTGL